MKNSLDGKTDSLNRDSIENMFEAPGKAVVVVFVSVWLVACSFMVLAMTDLFHQSFFNRKYVVSYILMGGASAAVIKICLAYYKSNMKTDPTKRTTSLRKPGR